MLEAECLVLDNWNLQKSLDFTEQKKNYIPFCFTVSVQCLEVYSPIYAESELYLIR